MKFFLIENRLTILPKRDTSEGCAKRTPACFPEGKRASPQPRQKPASGPGRQASTSPGCTCRASSIMQRAHERGRVLVDVSVPDEMGLKKKVPAAPVREP